MSTRSKSDRNCKTKSRVVRLDDSSDNDETLSKSASASKVATRGNKEPDLSLVSQLEQITNLPRNEAIQLLEACNNDLDMAVNLHLGSSAVDPPPPPLPKSTTASAATVNGRGKKNPASAMYEDVRAPIPQKTERLLDYDPYAVQRPAKRTRSVFDGFRDLQQEYDESDDGSSKSKKCTTLAKLFRPPIDILFSGSFDAAKRLGSRANRWILLNVQNTEEFECQCLNRDLWSDDTVKEIIKANFIFIQIYHDVNEGPKLLNYYNIKTYPFVGVIDPRTGEKLAQWSNKLDATHFCELVTNFLSDHELPLGENDDTADDDNESSSSSGGKDDGKAMAGTAKNGYDSPNLPNLKYLSFTDRVEATKPAKAELPPPPPPPPVSSTKLNAKQATEEIFNKKSSTLVTNNQHDTSSSSSDSDGGAFKNVKITNNGKKTNGAASTNGHQNGGTTAAAKKPQAPVEEVKVKDTVPSAPKQTRYETVNAKLKDCQLRIMTPNGDRLDFITDGDAAFKLLVDYLKREGYSKPRYDLIERGLSAAAAQKTSRNLFDSKSTQTFKELNLYPRIFLLLQDNTL